jgi:hypothetical protein
MYRIDETLSSTNPYYNNPDYDMAAAMSSTNHYPFYSNFLQLKAHYTLNYGITQMPIPTLNTPYLLNLVGANLGVTLDWKSETQDDVAFLLTYFPSANPSVKIVVDLTDVWGGLSTTANNLVTEKFNLGNTVGDGGMFRLSGGINNFSVEEQAGAVVWDYSMTLYVGIMEG